VSTADRHRRPAGLGEGRRREIRQFDVREARGRTAKEGQAGSHVEKMTATTTNNLEKVYRGRGRGPIHGGEESRSEPRSREDYKLKKGETSRSEWVTS